MKDALAPQSTIRAHRASGKILHRIPPMIRPNLDRLALLFLALFILVLFF